MSAWLIWPCILLAVGSGMILGIIIRWMANKHEHDWDVWSDPKACRYGYTIHGLPFSENGYGQVRECKTCHLVETRRVKVVE